MNRSKRQSFKAKGKITLTRVMAKDYHKKIDEELSKALGKVYVVKTPDL